VSPVCHARQRVDDDADAYCTLAVCGNQDCDVIAVEIEKTQGINFLARGYGKIYTYRTYVSMSFIYLQSLL
jgi:hypothetical protein